MPKAGELLRWGRNKELWEMCCGYLNLDIEQFMSIQKRLLLGQVESLSKSKIGRKIMNGMKPVTVDEFRQMAPLTTYADYCPELAERMEDSLPEKPAQWVHTSGKSGQYACKWVPITTTTINNLSPILYGIGLMSSCKEWGDSSKMPAYPKIIYTVAPRPYISGALASMIGEQTPLHYYPSLAQSEKLHFEDRIKLGFQESLSGGLDYFFGLSLVLAAVGEKFSQSAGQMNILPLLLKPKALMRITRGMIKSKLAGRRLMPMDLWNVKGIITSGLDSSVYKEKIKGLWGRYPLDIYACTEGGVIATQTWDFNGMTFIPNLNFLEFIPEKEHMKWQIDHKYKPKTVLLDEVKAGECYEIVITNLGGGALCRYRIGDMIRITSLRNDKLGIETPQMVFERRADDLIDFVSVRLSEKNIWQAIENIGIPYEDWVAFKKPGELTLNILLEPNCNYKINENEMGKVLYKEIIKNENEAFGSSEIHSDGQNMIKLDIKVTQLTRGSFARYTSKKRAEGADLAHLKPPHINPPQSVISTLLFSGGILAEEMVPDAQAVPLTKIS
jgi:hypothetical protein